MNIKNIAIGLLSLIGLLLLIFLLNLYVLGSWQFFAPKKENIRREIFENTKSFTHGKIQELGKLYNEFQQGTKKDKDIIRTTIEMRFAEFDETKIKNYKLQQFLINQRGY